MDENKRGSIAFFATYRPPVPLDIFSCALTLKPTPEENTEISMTDDDKNDYNYNGQEIPPAALKTLLKHQLASKGYIEADVDSGRLSGIVFVSERGNLELLRIALRFDDNENPPTVHVFSLADVFGASNFCGVRMEDSGRFALDHLIYVSTKEPATKRRQPWTAVYKTNLKTGKTDRLTPPGQADLSPSVSPCGKKIAVASFEGKGGWAGEIEDLMTDIYVMSVEDPSDRRLVVKNGGWPSWGSENVIFFHRKNKDKLWGVYRVDIGKDSTSDACRMTPDNIDGFTPAAIDANRVVVVTVRERFPGLGKAREEPQYRQIEIFDLTKGPDESTRITQNTRSTFADHFNPFVIDGGKRIGYHRARGRKLEFDETVETERVPFQTLDCPLKDVGLFRVSGVFPTISHDGSMLAFVDNTFRAVWVVDKDGLHTVYEEAGEDKFFSPVWDQCEDTLYVSAGPSFNAAMDVNIIAISNVKHCIKKKKRLSKQLTDRGNNAFPSSSPDGKRLVFRSVFRSTGKDGHENLYKNLYIMENKKEGVLKGVEPKRLTNGEWVDTHCQWSPRGNWIVFSSTRDKPSGGAPDLDNGLDLGYFALYLVNPDDPDVVIRVMKSGSDISGHVNHSFFSPDGLSIVVTSDLAGVSVDPISLPLFDHSVRPYGDIFTINIDPDHIEKNKDVEKYDRITHSKYENSTAIWTKFSTASWEQFLLKKQDVNPVCPYDPNDEKESWHMTGHLVIPKRCC